MVKRKRPFLWVLTHLCFPCSSLIYRREIILFRFDGLFCGFAVFDSDKVEVVSRSGPRLSSQTTNMRAPFKTNLSRCAERLSRYKKTLHRVVLQYLVEWARPAVAGLRDDRPIDFGHEDSQGGTVRCPAWTDANTHWG